MEEWWSSMEGAGRGSQDRNICPTPIFSINLGLAEFSYTISL